jgi:Cu+-exporting ATPase
VAGRRDRQPRLIGLLAFGDTIKPARRAAVEPAARDAGRAHGAGQRRQPRQRRSAVAAALGIDDVRAEVLPQDKAESWPN